MDKKELERLICDKKKKAEKERGKRECIVVVIYTFIFFFLYCFLKEMPDKLGDAVSVLIVSFVFAGLHVGISQAVFEHLFVKEELADNEIKDLQKELHEMERQEKE